MSTPSHAARHAARSAMSASTNVWRRHRLGSHGGARLRRDCADGRSRSCRGSTTCCPSREQRLDEVRADETGAAGHEPAQRLPRASSCGGAWPDARGSPPSQPPDAHAAGVQRGRVGLALDVDVEPAGLDLRRRNRRSGAARTRGARRPRPSRARAAARPTATRSTPYSCRASAGSAIGSCTWTLAPYDSSSRTTSITRELRRSGQFSLNVSPSTITVRALDREARLDHLLHRLLRRRTCPCRR